MKKFLKKNNKSKPIYMIIIDKNKFLYSKSIIGFNSDITIILLCYFLKYN